ncbi:MAG: Npun_F0494 family protein [Pseudanabaena sp.]
MLQRAEIALRCAPFTMKLFADMASQGVNLRAIAGNEGLKNQYLTRASNLIITENALLWLIQVGVLRREVDGQGITDSFRLTPMGHLLLDKWKQQSRFPVASISDRLQNFWTQIQISRFL